MSFASVKVRKNFKRTTRAKSGRHTLYKQVLTTWPCLATLYVPSLNHMPLNHPSRVHWDHWDHWARVSSLRQQLSWYSMEGKEPTMDGLGDVFLIKRKGGENEGRGWCHHSQMSRGPDGHLVGISYRGVIFSYGLPKEDLLRCDIPKNLTNDQKEATTRTNPGERNTTIPRNFEQNERRIGRHPKEWRWGSGMSPGQPHGSGFPFQTCPWCVLFALLFLG